MNLFAKRCALVVLLLASIGALSACNPKTPDNNPQQPAPSGSL
jgi:hypothetical protein